MNDAWLTRQLAQRVHGWKAAPGRFVKANRSWTPERKFSPLTNVEQAFALLDAAASAYTLAGEKGAEFRACVRVGERVGEASNSSKARAATMAQALGLGVEECN
jgi:hypothetical protein